MAKVYIVNDTNHDFSKAERFGTLEYITKDKVPFFKTDYVATIIKEALVDFDANHDYILLSGPPILCVMSTLEAFRKGGQAVKTLLFDAKQQDYQVRHINM